MIEIVRKQATALHEPAAHLLLIKFGSKERVGDPTLVSTPPRIVAKQRMDPGQIGISRTVILGVKKRVGSEPPSLPFGEIVRQSQATAGLEFWTLFEIEARAEKGVWIRAVAAPMLQVVGEPGSALLSQFRMLRSVVTRIEEWMRPVTRSIADREKMLQSSHR